MPGIAACKTLLIATSEMMPPFAPGNIRLVLGCLCSAMYFRIAKASSFRGTAWASSFFVRLPGMVQTALFKSISSQTPALTSVERAKVNMLNRNASADTTSGLARSLAMIAGTSCHGGAAWGFSLPAALATLRGLGSNLSKLPFHRAGFRLSMPSIT